MIKQLMEDDFKINHSSVFGFTIIYINIYNIWVTILILFYKYAYYLY